MAEGITSFDGMTVPKGVDSADPAEPKTSSGGPIESIDGIDNGSSMGMPSEPSNAEDKPGKGSGSPISSEVE
jgi:hypothetical protein